MRLHFESPLAVYRFNVKKEMDLSEHIYIF